MQEFSTAESTTTSGVEEQGGVRWMTRVRAFEDYRFKGSEWSG